MNWINRVLNPSAPFPTRALSGNQLPKFPLLLAKARAIRQLWARADGGRFDDQSKSKGRTGLLALNRSPSNWPQWLVCGCGCVCMCFIHLDARGHEKSERGHPFVLSKGITPTSSLCLFSYSTRLLNQDLHSVHRFARDSGRSSLHVSQSFSFHLFFSLSARVRSEPIRSVSSHELTQNDTEEGNRGKKFSNNKFIIDRA
ncbi:hypothetical protein IE53DRAFT_110427 [Violaceomyces palustris]|uniref:Uncharacterized protein n=1 Tax=Violaceomyces palustris TaxID=1673888 RepID=A0ACD0NWK9_9BASI|nr:hypothetical protein IE53DRAFT_110427 [Violaceomyces palustris]